MRSAPVVEPRSLALGACVFAAMLAFASSALAQAGDLVILRNGGRLRGTVEVYEPGTRVVILLPDGSRRTLAGSEVERVQFEDSGAPAAPEPSPPPPQPEPSAPPPAEPSPPVAPVEPSPPPEPSPALGSAPATGDALSGGDLERLESIVGPSAPAAAVPVFGDGHRDEVPWNDVDPRTRSIYAPEGMLHLVVEGRVAVGLAFAGLYNQTAFRFGGDVAVGVGLRIPETILHFRAAAVLGMQSHIADDAAPGRYDGYYNMRSVATGFGYFALRGLAGVDLTSWLALRAGGEYGFEVLPVFDVVRIYGGPQLDLAFRLLDDRRLEIGVSVAVQDRSHAEVARDSLGNVIDNHAGTSWSPRLALTIAGVFL